jgi:hypothetical protein
MTFFTTAQTAALGPASSISENTGAGVIVGTNAEGFEYSQAAVRRLLRLKAGPVVRAPDDTDAFMEWLEE